MNIFSTKSGIVGEAPIVYLNRSLSEFFGQAAMIRTRLGKQSYLLDKYISYLLEAANKTIVVDAASNGFEVEAAKMNSACLAILRCDETEKEQPFYQLAKEYIDAHPLPFQETPTKYSIYCALLASEFLSFSVGQYQKKIENAYSESVDICDLRDLFRQVCALLGGEEAMERLNLLFRQRFLIATAMQIYLQGLTNQLMYALTMRDRETQKHVFQIILDEQLLSSGYELKVTRVGGSPSSLS